jgi:hypothetical protein
MGCVLRVSGKRFDVDAFLSQSQLEPLTVWHHGEPRAPSSSPTGLQNASSGMNVSVSTRVFSDLQGQINDSIGFLRTHSEELLRLKVFPGCESIEIDFPLEDRDVAVQTDILPPDLLSLLGSLGMTLAISRYPRGTPDTAF